MGKSDEYIDYKAYIGYLRKMTGAPADSASLRKKILDVTVRRSEMQIVYMLLKKLLAAVLFMALSAALLSFLFRHIF